jgi:L-ascorbate metabolism protein UlaG (beta-lactamase superfamily)
MLMGLRPLAVILVSSLVDAVASAQSTPPDTIPALGGDLTIVPIAHATVCIVHGQSVILVDPARFGPGLPPPPRADLEELANAARALPVTPRPDAPEVLVSALPVRPEQMARCRRLKPPTLILITDTHTDHLDPRAINALRASTTRLSARIRSE